MSACFASIANTLPTEPIVNGRKPIAWYDTENGEILCQTSEVAELLANIIDALAGDRITHTGYYNPEEDYIEPHGPFRTTGWYYIDFD